MIFIRRMLRHMIVRIKIPVAVDREVRAPFEWTILFRNRENPKEKYVDEDGAGTDTDPAVGTGGPETNFTFRRIGGCGDVSSDIKN